MKNEPMPDPSIFDGPRFSGDGGRVWDLMQGKSREERVDWMLNQQRGQVVWAFLYAAVRDQDLRAAWPLLFPPTRRRWVREWFDGNRPDLTRDDYDLDGAVEAMAADSPDHELWPHFERVTLGQLAEIFPPPEFLGMGVNTRLVAPDVVVFHIHDVRVTGDTWDAGQQTRFQPVLLRWNGSAWQVFGIGSEELPDDLM